jgi:hypothetical protein
MEPFAVDFMESGIGLGERAPNASGEGQVEASVDPFNQRLHEAVTNDCMNPPGQVQSGFAILQVVCFAESPGGVAGTRGAIQQSSTKDSIMRR